MEMLYHNNEEKIETAIPLRQPGGLEQIEIPGFASPLRNGFAFFLWSRAANPLRIAHLNSATTIGGMLVAWKDPNSTNCSLQMGNRYH